MLYDTTIYTLCTIRHGTIYTIYMQNKTKDYRLYTNSAPIDEDSTQRRSAFQWTEYTANTPIV